jgi:hypothetical protein
MPLRPALRRALQVLDLQRVFGTLGQHQKATGEKVGEITQLGGGFPPLGVERSGGNSPKCLISLAWHACMPPWHGTRKREGVTGQQGV